jgi:chloride channel 3/4/5
LLQIVVLVTKAVGDFLGTNGIADEMIRFNGFPFLEKEDHIYNVTGTSHWDQNKLLLTLLQVSTAMRKDLQTLSESGMRVKDVGTAFS